MSSTHQLFDSDAKALERSIAALAEVPLRVGYLRELLLMREPKEVSALLEAVIQRSMLGSTSAQAVVLATVIALADEGLEERRSLIRGEALMGGQTRAALLTAPWDTLDEFVAKRTYDRGERPLTLGERKSLARRRDRALIARALRDADLSVIAIVLDNPAVTESDVVILCATRPAPKALFRTIAKSTKWAVRLPVRLALVQNPYCPKDLGVRIVLTLGQRDRQMVGKLPDIPAPVRAACGDADVVVH